MRTLTARDAYAVLSGTLDEVRDRWTMVVCPTCFGRLNEADASPSWPKCECDARNVPSPAGETAA